MATFDETLAIVTDQSTKLDSVIALVDGLVKELQDILAGVTLPPAVQAKLDALYAELQGNSAKIVDALDTTPATPPEPGDSFPPNRIARERTS